MPATLAAENPNNPQASAEVGDLVEIIEGDAQTSIRDCQAKFPDSARDELVEVVVAVQRVLVRC